MDQVSSGEIPTRTRMPVFSIETRREEGEYASQSHSIIVGPFDPTEDVLERARLASDYRLVEAGGFETILLSAHLPTHAMTVWEFDKAPPILQELCSQGGDEDVIMYIPANLLQKDTDGTVEVPWHLQKLIDASDTCNEPCKFILPDGSLLFVGTH